MFQKILFHLEAMTVLHVYFWYKYHCELKGNKTLGGMLNSRETREKCEVSLEESVVGESTVALEM